MNFHCPFQFGSCMRPSSASEVGCTFDDSMNGGRTRVGTAVWDDPLGAVFTFDVSAAQDEVSHLVEVHVYVKVLDTLVMQVVDLQL